MNLKLVYSLLHEFSDHDGPCGDAISKYGREEIENSIDLKFWNYTLEPEYYKYRILSQYLFSDIIKVCSQTSTE